MRRRESGSSGVGEISENEERNNDQTITQGRLRIDANFKRFVDEKFCLAWNWMLPRSGTMLMRRSRSGARESSVAGRARSHSGALDEWHRSNPGPVKDKAAYNLSCVNWATWCHSLTT